MMSAGGYQAARTAAAVFDLSGRAKIALTGPDARSFLHNLCSQDVKALPLWSCKESFLTTSKAKAIAHCYVGHVTFSDGAGLLLDAWVASSKAVFDHLNRYLISEQVELSDRSGDLSMLRVAGPQSERVLQAAGWTNVPAPLSFSADASGALLRRCDELALSTYDLFCPAAEKASRLLTLQTAGAVAASDDDHETLRVEAGFPAYGKEWDENRFVVELGRTASAISYTKGCYLGQESIVMARDRGTVNRLLMGLKVPGAIELLPSGAKVYRGDEEVGQVTSSVFSPALDCVIALAYLKRGSWDAGATVTVADRAAVVSSLPFVAG